MAAPRSCGLPTLFECPDQADSVRHAHYDLKPQGPVRPQPWSWLRLGSIMLQDIDCRKQAWLLKNSHSRSS